MRFIGGCHDFVIRHVSCMFFVINIMAAAQGTVIQVNTSLLELVAFKHMSWCGSNITSGG
jgi:hypothetical protein